MDENTWSLVEEVVTLLRKRDFEVLRQHKLTSLKAVHKRLGERVGLTGALTGRALGDFVLDAIELMRPSSPERLSEPAWRHYILLKDYVGRGQPWGVVAARLGLGRTAFYNARKDAIESLTMVIDSLEAEARRELPQVRHNLPHPPYQYFIRRSVNEEDLVDRIISELGRRAWVLAIYGAAGVGKTALAYEVARQCCERRDFDAVIWTSAKEEELEAGRILKLPGLKRPEPADERGRGTIMTFGYETPLEAVLENIGRTLKVREVLTLQTLPEKRRRVSELLSTNSCLVIIDNLEALSEDAQDEIFTFLKELPVPSKAIVTSRMRHYIGETIVTVRAMGREEALRFMKIEAETRGLRSDDEELGAVYEKTGGVAKAMQYTLGLMHARGYSVEQALKPGVDQDILLDYLFERSYDELEQREKMALHVMPLFAEPASVEDIGVASTVPGVLLEVSLGKLYQLFLLDKVRLDRDRYELPLLARCYLRSIRQRRGLELKGRPIAEFLGEAYHNLAEHHARCMSEMQKIDERLAFLKHEKRNVISVMEWCYNNKQWDGVVALMHQMGHPLDILGYWDERIELGKRAAKAAKELGKPVESAWFEVFDIGWTYFLMGRKEEAREITERNHSLALGKKGFERVEALSIGNLGVMAQKAGDCKAALERLERSLTLWQEIGDQGWIAYALARLGRLKYEMGALDEAKRILEQTLELRSEIGYVGELAEAESELALVEFGLGNEATALDLSEGSLIRARLEIEPPSPAYAYVVFRRAELEERRGDLSEAKRRAQEALTLYKNLGHTRYKGAEVRGFCERLEGKALSQSGE